MSLPLDFELERDKYVEFVNGCWQERVLGGETHSEFQFKIVLLLKPIAKRIGASVHQEWTLAHGDEWLVSDAMLTAPGSYENDKRGYLLSTPLLCIEILSPGQTQSELLRKCAQYHGWGVPHCWVIDPVARIAFESHTPGVFQLIETNGTLTAGEVTLPASEIWTG